VKLLRTSHRRRLHDVIAASRMAWVISGSETGGAIFESFWHTMQISQTPVGGRRTCGRAWGRMHEDEIKTCVQQLENGSNVLVFSGESGVRSVGDGNTYVYKSFQRSICLPHNVQVESKTLLFCAGLLIVSFKKQTAT